MDGKKGKDDNTGDLFGGADDGGTAVVERDKKPAAKTPVKAESGGAGGTLPPHFAPMSGEFGDALPIGQYASTQYLQYAIATVKDRALPRVGDGQKPVQGRKTRWTSPGRAPLSPLAPEAYRQVPPPHKAVALHRAQPLPAEVGFPVLCPRARAGPTTNSWVAVVV